MEAHTKDVLPLLNISQNLILTYNMIGLNMKYFGMNKSGRADKCWMSHSIHVVPYVITMENMNCVRSYQKVSIYQKKSV